AHSGVHHPSLGAVVARLLGPRGNVPAYAVLPQPLENTGVAMWQGQRAGFLGSDFDPWNVTLSDSEPASSVSDTSSEYNSEMLAAANWQSEPDHARRMYGESTFGRSCLLARRLVERGVRFVTVNMFESL